MKNHFSPPHQTQAAVPINYTSIILDNVDDAFVFVNKDLNIAYANDATVRNMRVFYSYDLKLNSNVLDLVPPEQRAYLKNLYHDVFNGIEKTIETEVNAPDGSIRFFENTFKPAKDKQGQIIGAFVYSTDITHKKAAEVSLSEAEERWRFALESANQAVWDWDIKKDAVVFSKSYYEMFGYEEGEVKGSFINWNQRIHPEDRERVLSTFQKSIALKQKHLEANYRFKTKQNTYKYIHAKGMLLFDKNGMPERVIGVYTDRTKDMEVEMQLRKKNEEIRTANERFNYMMKATHDLIWDWDIMNNSIYRGDEGLKQVYGLQSNDVIPTINDLFERVHPEDLPAMQTTINNILKQKNIHSFELEYRFKKDDGTYSFVYDRGLVIRNEDGEAVRVIGAAQDISDRKKLEDEILNHKLEYQRTLSKATIDSQEQERSQIGKELHDNVNQILTTTKLYLDLALNSDNHRELIHKSLNNIADVINEIRQLSRSLMNPTLHDLGIIDSINDLIENINLTKKIEVFFNFDPEIEDVLSENQKLVTFRIIQESINNIVKHANATYAVITLSYKNDLVELTIEDDGIGFDPANVKKGAGLRNIQNRIYLINGTHAIHTEPGKGCKLTAKFNVSLNHLL